MALAEGTNSLAQRVGEEITAVRGEVKFALDGHLLEAGQTAANVPAGLPVGSLIFRKA